jgi:hypothetical protein
VFAGASKKGKAMKLFQVGGTLIKHQPKIIFPPITVPMPGTIKDILEAPQRDVDGLRQEYSEVNNYIRSHSNLRFTIFTVYLAAIRRIAINGVWIIHTKF